MFSGSVRDRIKAAEALEGSGKGHHTGHRHRGHKLALNTDEHIKEEFLRRGDGGWSKKVDIGQQEAYVPQPEVPFIKVTLETPIVESKEPKLPGKLPKSTFESISEEQEGEAAASSSTSSAPPAPAKGKEKEDDTSKSKGTEKAAEKPAEHISEETAEKAAEQPAGSSKGESQPRQKSEPAIPTIDPAKRECAPEYAEDTLFTPTPSRNASRRRSSKKSMHARVDDCNESHDEEDQGKARGGVDFHNVAWERSSSRAPSRASSKRHHRKSTAREERAGLGIDGADLDAPRSRSRSSRSKSAHREHGEQNEQHEHYEHRSHSRHSHSHGHGEAPPSPRIRKSSSRSGSTHKHGSESHHSPPTSARQSSNTLWPSFSQSARRSVSEMLETGSTRSKSPLPRPRSSHSTSTVRTDATSKTVEFAEYFAGQKLEHTISAPLSPPIKERPLGFVRSKSSTGEYSEYYTRDKHILRKPDEDDVFEATEDQKIHIDHHRHSSHGGGEKKNEDVPWQVKLMQGIARH